MATFTQTVPSEAAGGRAVKMVQVIVAVVSVKLSQKGGNVGRLAQAVGGTLCVTHMEGGRIRAYLG